LPVREPYFSEIPTLNAFAKGRDPPYGRNDLEARHDWPWFCATGTLAYAGRGLNVLFEPAMYTIKHTHPAFFQFSLKTKTHPEFDPWVTLA
jgi:hypothetical protein